ncbi:uncharacterized protein N7473_008269 [Penicillium subrubescens]|uniref:uncharacterized protein n=1 Tax=Penicillium subrubescens TaxID=1316194 RepID=UPI0025458A77|nr:uncharacterized protein N7473_008269 [Penicillium subrubescens]KAJ5892041.1 hypothetical protein N7473_008269 [Penicillium subrubescens]
MGTFTFKWPHSANEVFVTGTFDDWGKTVKLDRVGDIFSKEVALPADKKIQYKFVVDGTWTTDSHAREENDGHDNINNVLLPEDIQTQTQTQTQDPATHDVTTPTIMSGVTPDSTTAALTAQVPKEQPNGGLPGAFPDTPGQESDQILSVNPIPASGGYGNPIKLAPGEKVPDLSSISGNTVDSTVKLDKESYEKGDSVPLGSAGTQSDTAGSSAFTVPPVTKNLIPESSLPMGGPAQRAAQADQTQTSIGGPAQQAAMADPGYTIQSAAPTSTTAALAAEVPFEKNKQTNGTAEPAQSVPQAAANKEAVEEKKAMENELHKTVAVEQSTGAPAPTTAAVPVTDVPQIVKESIAESHQNPEAAANKEAVEEKSAVESELQKTVPVEESAGAPAPTTTAATAATAPGASLAVPPIDSTDVSPTSTPPPGRVAPTSAAPTSEPAPTETQTAPVVTTGVATSETAAKSTPEPAQQSANTSGAGEINAKEEKKKKRLSGFFSKLKEKLK